MDEFIYHKIAKRIADGLTLPTRFGPAAPPAPVLSKDIRLQNARAEAKAFLSDPETDRDHLAFILSLRWELTRREATALINERTEEAS